MILSITIFLLLQSSQTAFQEQHISGPELGDDELFSALNDDDITDGIDNMNVFNEIFKDWGPVQSPNNSPKREDGASRPGSPSRPAATHGQHSSLSDDGNIRVSCLTSNVLYATNNITNCFVLFAVRWQW